MQPLMFGPLKHVALIGSSPLFEPLADWMRGHLGLKVTILTAPDQVRSIAALNPVVVEKLSAELRQQHLKECGLALSFGARWIIGAELRKALFYDCLVNCHGTRLPFDKGGGNWSYRVMRSDRIGCVTLHMVDDGIDTGPIVLSEPYAIPRSCQTPEEILADYRDRLLSTLKRFIASGAKDPASYQVQPQPTGIGSYYPRLSTEEHGAIDWSMDGAELEKFILAFDRPYKGAWTLWNGIKVHLRDSQLHGGEARVNDWQAARSSEKKAASWSSRCSAAGRCWSARSTSRQAGRSSTA